MTNTNYVDGINLYYLGIVDFQFLNYGFGIWILI
jgi:hypothetical protein